MTIASILVVLCVACCVFNLRLVRSRSKHRRTSALALREYMVLKARYGRASTTEAPILKTQALREAPAPPPLTNHEQQGGRILTSQKELTSCLQSRIRNNKSSQRRKSTKTQVEVEVPVQISCSDAERTTNDTYFRQQADVCSFIIYYYGLFSKYYIIILDS